MSKNAKRQLKEVQARQTAKDMKRYEEKLPEASASIEEAIAGLESFPLTELQQSLVNYLHNNAEDVAEALYGLFD